MVGPDIAGPDTLGAENAGPEEFRASKPDDEEIPIGADALGTYSGAGR